MAYATVKFKAEGGFDFYHDQPKDLRHGDEKEVTEEEAYRLTTQFPKNFFVVKGKAVSPAANKAISPENNK